MASMDNMQEFVISIHALRGESDKLQDSQHHTGYYFNPRSPRGERLTCGRISIITNRFQSTLSEGRATANISKMLRGGLDRFPNF